uniref:Hydroxylysine kinase n=1 Tax=Acrobeloides nanus TaxID=290746 RepID=A0A914CEK4_9BILA
MEVNKDGFAITQAPAISETRMWELLKEVYGICNAKVVQLTGYDDLNFKLENCEFDGRNEALSHRGESRFILKFTNPTEARFPELLDAQTRLAKFLNQNGIICAETLPTIDGSLWKFVSMTENVSLPIRLFDFLNGRMLEQIGYTTEIYKLVGRFLARFHSLTENFEDPGFRNRQTFFSLENLDVIETEFYLLIEKGQFPDKERIELCEKAFRDVREKVFQMRGQFEQGLIHSDMNETNLLLEFNQNNNEYEIVGLLDFGDTHYSCRIFDIANAVLYLLLDVKTENYDLEFFQIGDYLIQGYKEVRNFSEKELHFLSDCMRARLALSLIFGIRTAFVNYRNVNAEYILKTQSNGWKVLKLLTETNFETMKLSYR